jgi:hypothetical protein
VLDVDTKTVQIEEESSAAAAGGRTGSRDGEQTKQEIEERCIAYLAFNWL